MKSGGGRIGVILFTLSACGGDDGRDATESVGTPGTTAPATTDTGDLPTSTTTPTTASTNATATAETTTPTTASDDTDETTATTGTTDATTAPGTSSDTGSDTGMACEDQPELCDALDNNCNDLFDEGCDCTPPDLELTAIDGYTARVILDVPAELGAYGRLGDVERAIGDYWAMPGEGVLFTLNNADNTGAGIGVMDQDGAFIGWIVDPAENKLPQNPYLEYAYEGVLHVCTTVGGDWIYKVFPDGTVETFVHHGECEGLVYGDRGDGTPRLYASIYSMGGSVWAIEADGARTQLAGGLPVVVDLALTREGSAFDPGLYAINQTIGGVNDIALDNTVTLDFPYTLGFGVGEELSFADPKSAFRDHFYHLASTASAVQRVSPAGVVETVLTGPKLNYGLYTTGAVFSTNGAYYFFTNEDELIMRLQACNTAGQ